MVGGARPPHVLIMKNIGEDLMVSAGVKDPSFQTQHLTLRSKVIIVSPTNINPGKGPTAGLEGLRGWPGHGHLLPGSPRKGAGGPQVI